MKKVLVIVGIIAGMSLTIGLYSKAHTIRYCQVIQECDKIVSILHPNGEQYDFFAYDSGLYQEDTIIKVSFNELKLSKQNYEINSANPKVIE